jgi:hypothetical protein
MKPVRVELLNQIALGLVEACIKKEHILITFT